VALPDAFCQRFNPAKVSSTTHRGYVFRIAAHGKGCVIKASSGIEQWRWTIKAGRELADDGHVLLPRARPHGGRQVVVRGYHRRAQFEYARVGGTRTHRLDDLLGIEARFHAQHHGFGAGD
jgi:hypothetical protein